MSETPGPKIRKDRIQDSSGYAYHLFPNSTNMGGVRRVKDPIAALIRQVGLNGHVIHLF